MKRAMVVVAVVEVVLSAVLVAGGEDRLAGLALSLGLWMLGVAKAERN